MARFLSIFCIAISAVAFMSVDSAPTVAPAIEGREAVSNWQMFSQLARLALDAMVEPEKRVEVFPLPDQDGSEFSDDQLGVEANSSRKADSEQPQGQKVQDITSSVASTILRYVLGTQSDRNSSESSLPKLLFAAAKSPVTHKVVKQVVSWIFPEAATTAAPPPPVDRLDQAVFTVSPPAPTRTLETAAVTISAPEEEKPTEEPQEQGHPVDEVVAPEPENNSWFGWFR